MIRAGAVAFLAHHEQQPETALPLRQQAFHRVNHGGDDAFGGAGRAAVDIGFVFARREKRRHRIHVGRERDRRGLAPAGEHVVPPRLDLDALDLAAVARGQGRQVVVQVLAHPLLIPGDGFDID